MLKTNFVSTTYNWNNIITVILFSLTLLYGVFHAGRYYEQKQAKQVILTSVKTQYIDYLIPVNASQPLELVNCIKNTDIHGLFSYAQVDY